MGGKCGGFSWDARVGAKCCKVQTRVGFELNMYATRVVVSVAKARR